MPGAVVCRSVGHLRPDPHWRMKAHAHPHHELIVVLRGRMQVTMAGGLVPAAAGDVLLYPAGVTHAERSDAGDPVESLFCGFAAPQLHGRQVRVVHDHDGRMRQIARWLHADQTGRAAAAREAQQLLFRVLLAEFTRTDRRPEPPLAEALRRYAQPRLSTRLTVGALAAAAGRSRYHFIRVYRRQTGRTPMADVRRLRLECARDWLLTTSLPLKEIARRSGLGGAQAFSRAFAAHQGQPPAAFRREHQGELRVPAVRAPRPAPGLPVRNGQGAFRAPAARLLAAQSGEPVPTEKPHAQHP